jgi:hypothetical protein
MVGLKNKTGRRIKVGQMIHNAPMTPEKARKRLSEGIVGRKEIRKWIARGWFTEAEIRKLRG